MNKTLAIELQDLREQIAKDIEGAKIVFNGDAIPKETQERFLSLQKTFASIARGHR